MQLRTEGGKLTLGSVFRLAAVGYAIGAGVLSAVMIVPVMLMLGSPPGGGDLAGQGLEAASAVMAVILLPVIVAVQSVMFALFVTFGLWIYSRRRPLTVV